MVLLIDVDLNTFADFLSAEPGFYWIETTKAYILIKPIQQPQVARTAFMKGDSEQELTFRLRWLSRQGAKQVFSMYLDGVNVVDLAPKAQVTVSSEEAIRKEDKEVIENE